MAYTYDDIEDLAVAQLQSVIADLAEIMPEPDNESEFKQLKIKPIIIVGFIESNFQPSTSTDLIKQDEEPMIHVAVYATKRRGEGGIFQMIKLIKAALQGFRIRGMSQRLQLKKIEMVSRDTESKTWGYSVSFTTQKVQQQVLEDDDSVGNYKNVDLNSSYINS